MAGQEQRSVPALMEGERLIPASRRPDGSLRKPVRIRAGYVPQDEVATYQSKGSQFRKGMPQVPPGYDPLDNSASKAATKAARKNEKRKEKRQQGAAGRPSEFGGKQTGVLEVTTTEVAAPPESVVQTQLENLTVASPVVEHKEGDDVQLAKRIRALKKKIRNALTRPASVLNQESLSTEQAQMLDIWKQELQDLEKQMSS